MKKSEDSVGRQNGVVSFVTVVKESSHVMSPFWSRYKLNQRIRLFHKPVLTRADIAVRSLAVWT